MRALVIGQGSIGRRHARILEEMGCSVKTVSRHGAGDFRALSEALSGFRPDYVVVAQETYLHRDTLIQLDQSGFNGRVLVEKPLFDRTWDGRNACLKISKSVFVGYHLRFHPLVVKARELIGNERCYAVNAYVGQHLPSWRPGRPYQASYSARRQEGGGALRDLSHELDYVTWITGPWEKVVANGGHFSDLEIDSDDVFSLIFKAQRCPSVTVEVNYLDRGAARFAVFHCRDKSIRIDFISGTLKVNDQTILCEAGRDQVYRDMHQSLLDGRTDQVCSFQEGCDILHLIERSERSAISGKWEARAP